MPNPTVIASADRTNACRKESVYLSSTGASGYTWTSQFGNTGTGAAVTATSAVATTINYTVTGIDANGCQDKDMITVIFDLCTALNQVSGEDRIRIYPNPAHGEFIVEVRSGGQVEIYNALGAQVRTLTVSSPDNYRISVSDLAPGVYIINLRCATGIQSQKVIVQ
jgi:hypothetical protein